MGKIWLESYPENVPAEINSCQYNSIVDMFEQNCMKFRATLALHNFGITLSYQQLDEYALAFAAYLQQELKLAKGDRFAIMLPNCLQYPIALFGALRAGLIIVNVNPLYTPEELSHQLKDAGANTIIVLDHFAVKVEQVVTGTALKNIIVTHITDFFSFPKAQFLHIFLTHIQKKIPAWNIPKAIKFKKILKKGRALSFRRILVSPDDIAFLQYTGGTTGVAKGAMLTHRNIVANILQADAWWHPFMRVGHETVITALPMYHIFSLTASCLYVMQVGGFNVLITNPRDIKHMVAEFAKFKCTMLAGVNTLFRALLQNDKFKRLNFTGLKLSLSGGMAMQKSVVDDWQTLTGCTILEGYGLTEASPTVTSNLSTNKQFTGTVGLPLPSTEVCILNDDGVELPIGQAGELAVKGPQIMRGYWQNPVETQKVFTKNGWLLTGDIAIMDAQGFLHIVDRKKDMILVSGFNVFPIEVETVLSGMPGIAEIAVVGVPDNNSGEAVKAFIVKSNPALTAEQIIDFCHVHLTGYKIPRQIEFCLALPKSNVGKILRRELRKAS